jgi:hypothetical protein
MKKTSLDFAYSYIKTAGVTGINLDGFLYANPDADIYTDKDYSGLMIKKERRTLLHSSNKDFLAKAYDSTADDSFFSCVERSSAEFLAETKGACLYELCHILSYSNKEVDCPPVDEGLTVKEIDLKDTDIINDFYTYKSEDSRERLMREISSRTSSALYDQKGNILAWNLLHDDFSMGVMFVPPIYRGKGYAQIVACDLMKKVIVLGKTPYIQVVHNNKASLSLSQKLGFKKIFEAYWFGKK